MRMMIFFGWKVRIIMNKSRNSKEEIIRFKIHDKFVENFENDLKS